MRLIPFKNRAQLQQSQLQQSGFTLIEVSIALIIIGLLAVPAMQTYRIFRANQVIQTSKADLQAVRTALQKYVFKNGSYPIPAALDVALDNGGGAEYMGAIVPCSANQTTVCLTSGVLIGAVPYAALNLPSKYALDGYDHKILYAVTKALTNSSTYTDNGGTIKVNGTGATNAHYVLVSFGPDGKGSFSPAGKLTMPCPTSLTALDDENCNNDNVFSDNNGDINSPQGATHFDDYVSYVVTNTGGLWSRNTPNLDIYNSGRKVGIGSSQNPSAMLDITGSVGDPGDLKADSLIVNRVCDYSEPAGCNPAGTTTEVSTNGKEYDPNVFAPGVIADTQQQIGRAHV